MPRITFSVSEDTYHRFEAAAEKLHGSKNLVAEFARAGAVKYLLDSERVEANRQ